MSDNDIDPKIKETLDEHVAWVNQATELAISEGAIGVQRAIAAPDRWEPSPSPRHASGNGCTRSAAHLPASRTHISARPRADIARRRCTWGR